MLKQNKNEIICYNPASLQLLGTVPVMSKIQVEDAVRRARVAQKKWAKTTWGDRRKVLKTIVQYVATHGTEIAEISREETGKTIFEGMMGEVMTSCGKLLWIADNGENILKSEKRPSGFLMVHKKARLDYIPYGTIGIIIPWNFPIHNALSHIATAIFSGNAAIVKVSEWGSWSVTYLDRFMKAALKACGHDPELIQFVTGFGETGSAVVSSTDKILFIGSPEVGQKVMENASKTLTPVILELGGKDPYIVCEDAPFDHAVNMAVRGAFFNCGQNCISAERFLINETIYDKFSDAVIKTATKVTQGYDIDGARCDIGSINLPGQLEKYQSLIDDAISKGAKVMMGGKIRSGEKGHFFEPTILANVNTTMRIMKEEIFGPILCMIKVKDDDHVVEIANDCDFGLGCSIFTTNLYRADSLAKRIESGMCVVNDWGLFFTISACPFGGIKRSGFGRFNGPEGLREFCYPRTFVTDRFPIVVTPPAWMNYPLRPRAHLLANEFIKMLYIRGLTSKAKSAFLMIKKIVLGDY